MSSTPARPGPDRRETANRNSSGQRLNPGRWRRLAGIGTALLLAVSMSACAAGGAVQPADREDTPSGKQVRSQIKLAIGEITPVWDTFKEVAQEEHGIDVELVSFQDWNLPNQALVHGEVDINAFQHILFLSQFNAANDETLRPVGVTSLGTMGIYSEGVDSLADIPENSQLLLPNDPTNQGRALLLLDGQGLITLDPEVGEFGSIENVIENPHGFEFVPLVAQQIATSLRDAGAGVTYQSQAVKAGIPQDSVLATDLEFVHELEFLPYQAVFAAREEDQDDPTWEVLEEIYRSPAVTEAYEKENRGLGVIGQASLDDLLDYQQRTEEILQTR